MKNVKNSKKTIIKASALLLCFVMCALLLMTAPAAPKVSAASADVQSLNQQIADLQQKQKDLEAKINNVDNESASALEQKAYLDSLAYTVANKITIQEQLLEALSINVDNVKKSIEDHETAIAETTQKIKDRMLANQQTGNASYFDVIIGAEGVGDFLSRVEMVNTLLDYDRQNLENYKSEKAELEAEKADLENSLALQQSTLEQLEADKANSETLSAQAASYYDSLQKDKKAYEAEYEAAKAQEAALDNELSAYLASLAQQNSSTVIADGNYMWPLPAGGYMSCYFGESDPMGRPHYAVDCAIAGGTPVYAANDGSVVRAQYHDSYGNYVLLDHGNGQATLYAHMSGLAVGAGQSVAKGQVIGYVGSTGFSTGNHLHFEFRINGQKVNPLSYCSQ